MNLNMFTLQESDSAILPENVRIRWLSHPITQIFMALLPKIDINGSSKIVVKLGPRGEEDLFDNVLGVTNIFIENFDFKGFLSLDCFTQNTKLLDELGNALITIATKKVENKEVVSVINATRNAVKKTQFQLTTQIKKLSKISKDKKQKINVFRLLSPEVGESWYCEITNSQNSTEKKIWMNDIPSFIDRSDYFKSAEIKDDIYFVKNRLGKIVFEMPLS